CRPVLIRALSWRAFIRSGGRSFARDRCSARWHSLLPLDRCSGRWHSLLPLLGAVACLALLRAVACGAGACGAGAGLIARAGGAQRRGGAPFASARMLGGRRLGLRSDGVGPVIGDRASFTPPGRGLPRRGAGPLLALRRIRPCGGGRLGEVQEVLD